MNKAPFVPPLPHVDLPSQETIDKLSNMTKKERRDFKKSAAYKDAVQRATARRKSQKKLTRKEWWWSKGIVILNTLLALIAAITGIIALLR